MAEFVCRDPVEHHVGGSLPRAFGGESVILTGGRMTSSTSSSVCPMSFPEGEGRTASWIAAWSFTALRENASTPKLSRNSTFQSSIARWSTASSFGSEISDTSNARGSDFEDGLQVLEDSLPRHLAS